MKPWIVLGIVCATACGPGSQDLPIEPDTPDVRDLSPLQLEFAAPTTIKSWSNPYNEPIYITWIKNDGSVAQRESANSPSIAIPGIRNAKSLALSVESGVLVVDDAGDLYCWYSPTPTVDATLILAGVENVFADGDVLVLMSDGRLFDVSGLIQACQQLDLGAIAPVADVTDVVDIKTSVVARALANNAGQYQVTETYFLRRDGTVFLREDVTYLSNQLPNTTSLREYDRGVRAVSADGLVQAADGRVYRERTAVGRNLFDYPAREFMSGPPVGSGNSETVATYVLFDDGALWIHPGLKFAGESPSSTPALFAVRIPGAVDVVDIAIVGRAALAVDRDGGFFLVPPGLMLGNGAPRSIPALEDWRR